MAWRNYAAGVAMSMPRWCGNTSGPSANTSASRSCNRRPACAAAANSSQRPDELARKVGEKIQRWQDEDEIASSSALACMPQDRSNAATLNWELDH